MHEIQIRREVAHRLDATLRVLSAKIGKHGSATHHFANVIGAMSLAFVSAARFQNVCLNKPRKIDAEFVNRAIIHKWIYPRLLPGHNRKKLRI